MTPEEFAEKAVSVEDRGYFVVVVGGRQLDTYGSRAEANFAAGGLRLVLAAAVFEYHAAALRESLAADPDTSYIDEFDYEYNVSCTGQEKFRRGHVTPLPELAKALRARCAAAEAALSDLLADQSHLVELGRRQERAEIADEFYRGMGFLAGPGHVDRGILVKLHAGIVARGPAAGPMPGDSARAVAKELEAENARLKEALREVAARNHVGTVSYAIAREALGEGAS